MRLVSFRYLPVPDSDEVCGLPTALSLTLAVPVLAPLAVGVNVMLILQLLAAANVDPQVVVETAKSPVVEIVMPVKATACLLVRVNTFAAVVVPTVVDAKARLAGVNVAWAMPVPVRGTDCGLLFALSVIVIAPVRVPVAVGVKFTSILQFLPAASVAPQGFALAIRAKSPLTVMLPMDNVPLPLLVMVTIFPGAVLPTTTAPQVSEVGDNVTAPLPPVGFTVRLIVVV
jgi:hypothetical protein